MDPLLRHGREQTSDTGSAVNLSLWVQLIPRCAQLLPCHILLPTAPHRALGSPMAPIHTEASLLCHVLGVTSGVQCPCKALPGAAPASQLSFSSMLLCAHPGRALPGAAPSSHTCSYPTLPCPCCSSPSPSHAAAEQPAERGTLLGWIISKRGWVELPITAAGSVCCELKSRESSLSSST